MADKTTSPSRVWRGNKKPAYAKGYGAVNKGGRLPAASFFAHILRLSSLPSFWYNLPLEGESTKKFKE